ncbi:hypothetical protein TNCV_2083391 [Trichonephila clavipes]|nr:hypothetical protein TNCV_2083391 [Trichonephila clavipes]
MPTKSRGVNIGQTRREQRKRACSTETPYPAAPPGHRSMAGESPGMDSEEDTGTLPFTPWCSVRRGTKNGWRRKSKAVARSLV